MIAYYSDFDLVDKILDYMDRRRKSRNVRIMLAEGDSWFSLGGATSNLLMALDDDDKLIVSCAMPGDTLRHIADMGNDAFENLLSDHFGLRWDAVLLSAGGNDIIGDVASLVHNGRLSQTQLRIELDWIGENYRRLVSMVRKNQHECPIHAHTYDYPVCDPRGGWFRLGPWIGDKLVEAGINPQQYDDIVTDLIDSLADCIGNVAELVVHDTRMTLTPGRWRWWGGQEDWRNEIHPSFAGYRKLAVRWGNIA